MSKTSDDDFFEKRFFRVYVILTSIFIVLGFLILFITLMLIFFPSEIAIGTRYLNVPKTCVVTQSVKTTGVFGCPWNACREGCNLKQLHKCYKIRVNVTSIPWSHAHWDFLNYEDFYIKNASLLINHYGCSNLPSINCTEFAEKFGTVNHVIPCYYDPRYPFMAVVDYSLKSEWDRFVLTLMCQIMLFLVGVVLYFLTLKHDSNTMMRKMCVVLFMTIWIGLFYYSYYSRDMAGKNFNELMQSAYQAKDNGN